MADFLVEIYVSRTNSVDASVARARAAAEELTREGTPVDYVSSIFVPEDETCFFLYQPLSAAAVREAAQRASLVFERICEAVATRRDQPL